MNLPVKILLPVIVLAASVFGAKVVLDNGPEPRKRPQFPTVQAVEAITLAKSRYQVTIHSQGTVQPTRASTLVPEVNGSVTSLSTAFVVGGSFKAGDVLLQIDERDYSIALTQAKANLAQAQAQLQEEAARGKLAKTEWESLGRGKASSFTLRQPQLAASRANRDAARAQVQRAELDLERTRIIAPYDGKVLEKSVDEGQFVSRGAKVGRIYSTASVDVRLPLSSRQLTYLDIPVSADSPMDTQPDVELLATIGGRERVWSGKLVRAEGVDSATQQLNVIARISDPFANTSAPVQVGQYVSARIAGRLLDDVFVLPRSAVREDREVLLVNGNGELERRDVQVAWTDDASVAVNGGLEAGAVLVTTALSSVTNGTPVRATVDGVAPARQKRGGGQRGADGKPGDAQKGKGNRGQFDSGQAASTAADATGDAVGEDNGKQGKRGEGKRGDGQRGDGSGKRRQGKPDAANAKPADETS